MHKMQTWLRKGKPPFKRFFSITFYILKGYLMAIAVILLLQSFFIYHPTNDLVSEPTRYGADYVTYASGAGDITSWYCKAKDGKPTLIMFHGNAGNISHRSSKQAFFCLKGYGFLLAEYRGYNGNTGWPSEEALYEDARSAISWLKDSGTQEDNIILYGESIGTGVAIQMALEHSTAKGLILEASFTSMRNIVKDTLPWLSPFSFFIIDRYDNVSKIAYIKMPIQLMHGDEDSIIPVEHSKTLFSKNAQKDNNLILLTGGNHNNLADYGLLKNIQGFLIQLQETSRKR